MQVTSMSNWGEDGQILFLHEKVERFTNKVV